MMLGRFCALVVFGLLLASGCTLLHALEGASVVLPVDDAGSVVVAVRRPDGG